MMASLYDQTKQIMRVARLTILLTVSLLAPFIHAQSNFVELTADIETVSWNAALYDPPSFESQLWKVRCIVGTNSWLITASNQLRAPESWFYSGSNLVHKFSSTAAPPAKAEPTNSPPIVRAYEFNGDFDGGTTGPFLDPHFRVAWLAFCSGPFLSRPQREIPMPDIFWKESWLYFDHAEPPLGFPDKTFQFEDDLALPISVELFSKGGQPLFQYHVKHGRGPHVVSTNLLGWDFPLEFRAMQYLPLRGAKDRWQASLIAHGTLTSIKAASAPSLAVSAATKAKSRSQTNDSYWIKASGPVSYNLITNSPSQNKAKIFLTNPQAIYDQIAFTVTNAEPREILLWNVRIQTKSPAENPGTDGFGWDTIYDDFPNAKDDVLKPGQSTQLTIKLPDAPLWRVCVLYSKRDPDAFGLKTTYSGNYEIISEPIDEATVDKADSRH